MTVLYKIAPPWGLLPDLDERPSLSEPGFDFCTKEKLQDFASHEGWESILHSPLPLLDHPPRTGIGDFETPAVGAPCLHGERPKETD